MYEDNYLCRRLCYKMKRKKFLILALVLVVMMSITSYAAEIGSLGDCSISLGIASNGLRIACDTNSTTRADEIGVKDIVLQEKVNGVWKNININGGSERDSYDYTGSVVYTNAVKGRSYRAHCTHYAKYGSTTKTLYGEVGPIVYN